MQTNSPIGWPESRDLSAALLSQAALEGTVGLGARGLENIKERWQARKQQAPNSQGHERWSPYRKSLPQGHKGEESPGSQRRLNSCNYCPLSLLPAQHPGNSFQQYHPVRGGQLKSGGLGDLDTCGYKQRTPYARFWHTLHCVPSFCTLQRIGRAL